MMNISHLNQKDMKNCKLFASLITKGVQNVHHLHGHMSGDAFFTGQLQCQLCPVRNRTIAYLAQLQTFKPVKDSE